MYLVGYFLISWKCDKLVYLFHLLSLRAYEQLR